MPSFILQNKTQKTGRLMFEMSEIDVNRDILELIFVLNSDQDPNDIEYFLELEDWTEKYLEIRINFTNPLLVSLGFFPD